MKRKNFKLINILIFTSVLLGISFIKSYASTPETQENTISSNNEELNVNEMQNQIQDFRNLNQLNDVPLPVLIEMMFGVAGFNEENCTII